MAAEQRGSTHSPDTPRALGEGPMYQHAAKMICNAYASAVSGTSVPTPEHGGSRDVPRKTLLTFAVADFELGEERMKALEDKYGVPPKDVRTPEVARALSLRKDNSYDFIVRMKDATYKRS